MTNFVQLILYSESELKAVPVPFGFDSWLTFWLIFVIAVGNAILMTFVSYKFFQVLQLSGYRLKGLFAWLKENKFADWGKLIVLSFLSSAALLITNVLLEDFLVFKIMTYLGLVFYALFTCVYIVNVFSVSKKTPLKQTSRMKRMIGVFSVLIFVITFVLLSVSVVSIPYFTHGIIGLTPMLVPIIVVLAYLVMYPIEKSINKTFISLAKKKLDSFDGLIKIGITGSYGKTSVKNILSVLLSTKYKVVASPYSYNTPLGLSKTILENLKPSTEVFIAEMGARYVGDIDELSKMIEPNIGVITGIGNQHLATFNTRENLIKTKFELADYVLSHDGKMFVSADSSVAALESKNRGIFDAVVFAGLSGENSSNVTVENISYSVNGCTFDLSYNGKTVKCSTSLLGRHNISNIALAASVALNLGVTLDDIQKAISSLIPTSHRLALVPSSSSLVVLDDAYNGSVEGTKAALEVLGTFSTKKFVITPGLVELGGEQFNSNFEFGKNLAHVADYIIITGTTNYDAICAGFEFGDGEKSRVLRAASVAQAVELMQTLASPGDVCLFENDLPDNYS